MIRLLIVAIWLVIFLTMITPALTQSPNRFSCPVPCDTDHECEQRNPGTEV